MYIQLLRITTLLALLLPASHAQLSKECISTNLPDAAQGVVKGFVNAPSTAETLALQNHLADIRRQFANFLLSATTLGTCLGVPDRARSLAVVLEAQRIDKQVGSAGGTSGSTSPVSSGSIPALLGLAVEYGGLTEAFSGTTATFRTTPAKLLAAMGKAYGGDDPSPSDRTLQILQRVSLAASFDTARTGATDAKTATLQANYQQLSQASARFLLIHDRDPFEAKNLARIRALSQSDDSKFFANRVRDLLASATKLPSFDEGLNAAMKRYDALASKGITPVQSEVEAIAKEYLEEIQKLTSLIPGWREQVDRYAVARLKLDAAHRKLYRDISKAPTLSLEIALNRPPVVSVATAATSAGITPIPPVIGASTRTPDLTSASLIYTASLMSSEYTFNAKANFFNEALPGMSGNFRDFQLSGKWDIAIGKIGSSLAKGTLTFSGLYENLHQKPLGIKLTINDQTINQPGSIGLFQAKYTIPIGDSGVQIPISFTASNRTELVKEKEVRGNIGISFDLDKLFKR